MAEPKPEGRPQEPAPIRPAARRRRRRAAALALAAFALAAGLGAWKSLRARPFAYRTPGVVRFALCQCEAVEGDPQESFDAAMRAAETAAAHGADVVVLPEFSFSTTRDVRRRYGLFSFRGAAPEAGRVAWFARRHGCYFVVNNPYLRFVPDKLRRNETLVFGPDGRVCTNYHKRVLARIDRRIGFSPGPGPVVAEFPFGRVGLLVCKDSTEPDKFGAYADADLLLVQYAHLTHWSDEPPSHVLYTDEPSATARNVFPYLAGELARRYGLPVLTVNKTGLESIYAYLGGSTVVAADGTVVARASTGPAILYVDLPLGPDGRLSGAAPVVPDLERPPPTLRRRIENRFFRFVARALGLQDLP